MAEEKKRESEHENGEMGFPVHSQVMKIRREFDKVKHPALQQPPEMTRLLHTINRQRSRSPLGLPHRPISVGN
ncbi:hypothetical protein Dsin_009255 [Dipteronia sinensis]|uniref:Uncharacterized protein n=1 Tax=Dipteronia sinensis TaxID=43782 RepID=A0AAE0AQY4_9ROSI|nr:hypothetical protein Dsin_009255 [Dipteronia sinensis]